MEQLQPKRQEVRLTDIEGSLQHYENFINSVVWKDLRNSLAGWLADIRDQLEEPSYPLSDLNHLQGSAFAVRRMLDLPDRIMEAIKDNLGMEEEEDGN